MPRPSWRRYRRTPPSLEMVSSAWWSWPPQSHLRDMKTSPVRHSEWTRTVTGLSCEMSPLTRARWWESSMSIS